MQRYELPYGSSSVELMLPEKAHIDWIEPAHVSPALNPMELVSQAVKKPIDGREIKDFLPTESVAIAINDKTRPVPHHHLLPPLLAELHENGIPRSTIKLFIANGTHVPMRLDEYSQILPDEIIRNYEVISHNCDDLKNLCDCGTTSRGTSVWVNEAFKSSKLKIMVGNIEPHHFAGFSGGYKTAAIGLTGRQTINMNHKMLIDPLATIAEFSDNPLRQDIEEIGKLIGVDLALNVVLNGDRKIVHAIFGNPAEVIKTGIPISQKICQVAVKKKYDLVIASAGGAPKDINFYQAQKALTHASLLTRDGGVIVLVAACPEGTGSKTYESFMKGIKTPEEVFNKFRKHGFEVGPHKALQVARDAARLNIILLSMIPVETTSKLLMTPAKNLPDALTTAFQQLSPTLPENLHIAILPKATNTIPLFS